MTEENQIQEIHRKTRELYTLRNRILRYWKKLVSISAEELKKQGIDKIVLTDNYEDQINNILMNPRVVQAYEKGDSVNANELIEFSKNVAPSLYRRYYRDLRKYNLLQKELDS